MLKRFSILGLVVILALSMVVGCTSKKGSGVTVGMITDTGGLGDQSFNDSANKGLKEAEKDYGIKLTVIESATQDDYIPNLTTFAQKEQDLIFAIGCLLDPAMEQASKQFPNQKYAIIDGHVPEGATNVAAARFAENEGSFLVGVIAGLKTESNKIGFIGGLKIPSIQKFEYGFRAGVKAVNPKAEVFVDYANSFTDTAIGKELGLALNQRGADIVYHAAGGVGTGMIQAAEEKGFWAIGVDQDQSYLAPKNVLCSMLKEVGLATKTITKAVVDDKFEGRDYIFNLKNEGVGYSDKAGNLTDDLKEAAEKYKKAILDGSIKVVPQTEEEFNSIEIPNLLK
ncbi:BMP family ABC transporter substrate-binding protein [Clostridiaceae bacterium M8S5]|nr:BMP family ABC transporter substrate-binding protein [Clostridiaceae bacterium M8S5]